MAGWVKIHRSIAEWEWYADHNTTRLFIHMLLKANHAPGKWKGNVIPAGTFITGRDALAKEVGLSVQQIRTSLSKLKSTGEITIKSTNKYSTIAMNNWCEFQLDNQHDNQQVTNKQPTNNQQVTTNKKDKKENNEKKKTNRVIFIPPSHDEVKAHMRKHADNRSLIMSDLDVGVEADLMICHYESKGWLVGSEKMKNWKSSASGWITRGFKEGKIARSK